MEPRGAGSQHTVILQQHLCRLYWHCVRKKKEKKSHVMRENEGRVSLLDRTDGHQTQERTLCVCPRDATGRQAGCLCQDRGQNASGLREHRGELENC